MSEPLDQIRERVGRLADRKLNPYDEELAVDIHYLLGRLEATEGSLKYWMCKACSKPCPNCGGGHWFGNYQDPDHCPVCGGTGTAPQPKPPKKPA